jgi:alginate O-acetyltransferase complex protein AlgI
MRVDKSPVIRGVPRFGFASQFALVVFAGLALATLSALSSRNTSALWIDVVHVAMPALASVLVIGLVRSGVLPPLAIRTFAYLIFFSVAALTATGFMSVMNGLAVSSPNPFLYGYSFYSASLAYLVLMEGRSASFIRTFDIANPLMLATGPLAISVASMRHWSLRGRLNYFFPFLIIGVFLFIVLGLGLAPALVINEQLNLVSGLLFGIVFELFIYVNFAGLSLIVYAVAGIIGMRVPLNFKQPFSAANILDFWKGWHLSLSALLKELFYKPVRARWGTYTAVMVTYLASASWHGMTVNFAIWGFLHGAVFVASIVLLKRKHAFWAFIIFPPTVVIARMIFGTPSFDSLVTIMNHVPTFAEATIATQTVIGWPTETLIALTLSVVLVVVEFAFRKTRFLIGRNYKFLRVRVTQVVLMAAIVMFASGRIGDVIAAYGQR